MATTRNKSVREWRKVLFEVIFEADTRAGKWFDIVMILGYSIIAVPTGIVTAKLTRASGPIPSGQACPRCSAEGHDRDALCCKFCGARL